jgi:hypothetical protein
MDDRFRRSDFFDTRPQQNYSSPSNSIDSRFQMKRPPDSDYAPESENKYSRNNEFRTCHSVKSELISPDSPEPIESPDSDKVSIVSRFFPASQPKTFLCRLCNNDTFFKSETDFDIHLTVIHFREKLMRKIQEPFRCHSCGYVPLPSMTTEDQSDDLLMHYGCKEHLSQMYYNEEVAKLPRLNVDEKGPETITIVCKLCNSSFDTERLFVRHISLRHFPKQLCDDLPKSEPFICPFIDCGQEKYTIHNLMLHYGCEHNISMELYQKETRGLIAHDENKVKTEPAASPFSSTSCSPFFASYMQKITSKRSTPPTSQSQVPILSSSTNTSSPALKSKIPAIPAIPARPKEVQLDQSNLQFSCKFCPEKNLKFSTKKSLKYHILFSHLFTDLPQNGPCECPVCFKKFSIKNVFASHFLERHYEDYVKEQLNQRTEIQKMDIFTPEKYKSSHSKEKSKSSCKEDSNQKAKSSSRDEPSSKDSSKEKQRKSSLDDETSSKKSHSHQSTSKHGSSSSSSKHSSSKSSSKHSSSKSSSKHSSSKSSSKHSSSKSSSSKASEKGHDSAEQQGDGGCTTDKLKIEEGPIPACRVRQTVHSAFAKPIVSSASFPSSTLSARQKLLENWKKDSIDSQRFEIDQLKEKIQEMETAHAEALKKKAEEFERWITQKEKALEDEQEKRKEVESKLEEISVVNAETELQLVQHQSNLKALENELEEKANAHQQVLAEKKKLEKENASHQSEVIKLQCCVEERTEELKLMQQQLQEKNDHINSLEEDIKDLKNNEDKVKQECEKTIAKLEKSVEAQVKKVEKLTEEKKAKMTQIKDMTKKHQEVEIELKDQVSELTKLNKQLNAKINTQKTALEKSAKSEMKRLEKDHDKIEKQLEEYEAQLLERNTTIEKLESRKDDLLDSLLHIQKIMQGFEAVITDKNEKLLEQESKIADIEAILEESVDKVNKLKTVEKEKKELAKQVKQLQHTMQDWETRQFTNVKLISGLEKTKAALEKKVKDFEENHTGAEEELYEMSSQIRQHEKEIKRLKESLAVGETELAKTKVRLQTKSEELTSVLAKNEILEQKIRDLEREVREKSNVSEEVQHLKQTVSNKEAELAHLRLSLNNLKAQFNQMKSHSSDVESQLKSLKASNGKFETEYSFAVSQIETLKKALKDAKVELGKRDLQLASFRETVLKDTHSLSSIQNVLSNDTTGVATSSNVEQVCQIVANLNQILIKEEPTPVSIVKAEPIDADEQHTTPMIQIEASVRVNTDKQIVLNVPGSFTLLDPVKEEPIIPNPATFDNEDIAAHSDHDDRGENGGTFEFFNEMPFASRSAESVRRESASSSLTANSPSPSIASSGTLTVPNKPAAKKRKSNQLPDVTGQHFPDEDTTVCGICHQFDPPPSETTAKKKIYTTEWVGCDCDRWFHKPCTKLQRFTSLFSCRSVKMKCQGGHNNPSRAKKSKKKQGISGGAPPEDDDINMTIVHRESQQPIIASFQTFMN